MEFPQRFTDSDKDGVSVISSKGSSPGALIRTEPPIPPGDDSWDREHDLPPQPFDLWTRTNVGESLPFPITPLTQTNFPLLFKLDAGASDQEQTSAQMMRRFYGRLYINEGAVIHSFEEYGIPATLINRTWGSRQRGNQAPSRLRPLRLLRNLPKLLKNGLSAIRSKGPRHTPVQFFAQIDQWVDPFLQRDLSQLDDRALWAEGLPVWRERGGYAFATNIRLSMPSAYTYLLLERLVKWWTGQKTSTQDLVTSASGVYSAEVGPALWRMAEAIKESGLQLVLLENDSASALAILRGISRAQTFIGQLEQFLARHGHRCPNELELLNPRWAEAPEQVVELVKHYLQADESANPIAAEARQWQRSAEAVAAIETRLDPVRRAISLALLNRTRRAITVRDNIRYYLIKLYFPMRKLYAQLGQRWAARGWLSQADDIFFLTVSEIEKLIEGEAVPASPADLQACVANRRIAYQYWFTVTPPDTIGPDGAPLIEEKEQPGVLKGIGASKGRVRGRARIVQDIHEAMQLGAGDILVTRATDPGWTPVFPLVSGIVLEIGGQLSHGAIVAREYAIPAVINVPGAMRSIQDGQTIEIDGTSGEVFLDRVI
jgi:phosphohistidine swiveling domain-containing protein